MMRKSVLLVILAGSVGAVACGGGGGSSSGGDDSGDAGGDSPSGTSAEGGEDAGEGGSDASDATADTSDAPVDGTLVESGSDAPPDVAEAMADVATDSAESASCGWTPYNTGLSGGNMVDVQYDVRTSPARLYATGGGSLYTSADNGATWTTQGTFAGGSIDWLATPGSDPNVLLATSSAGIIQSMDGGHTWAVVSFQNVAVSSITAAPGSALRVYVGVSGGGVYRSDDQGTTWAAMNGGYPFADTIGIDVAPDNSDDVVTSANLLTAQGGWSANGVVMRTTDGGQTWTTVLQNNGDLYGVKRCTANPTVLYAATGNGIAKSVDRGATWTVTSVGNQVTEVAITPGACDDVYAMVYSVGPEHSTDGGQTFGTALTQGLNLVTPGSWPGKMVVAPRAQAADAGSGDAGSPEGGVSWDQTIVLGSQGGIRATTNGGTQWNTGAGILGLSLRSLMTSPLDPGHLWLSSWGSGIWHRPSASQSWQRIPTTVLPVDYTLVAAPDPYMANRVLVGARTLYVSTDDGTTFTATSTQLNEFGFGFDGTDAGTLYTATQTGGVLQSTNAGTSWSAINGNLTAWATASGTFIDVRSVIVAPGSPQTLYIGTDGAGVQKTTNGGTTWTNVLSPTGVINCLLLVPGSPSTLYACVGGGGIRSSTDGGGTWTDVSSGLPTQDVSGLAYDSSGGGLYATAGKGLYQRMPGQSWTGVDVSCTPAGGISTPAILVNGSARSVVIGAAGGVYSHPI
jgi:hypothetical protein